MENTNKIISQNLVKYRTSSGMTQAELAEKISYSDKSISKWERGEGLPDINILIKLARIYNISLDELVGEEAPQKKLSFVAKFQKHKKLFISLLAGGLTWFVATAIFVALYMIPSTSHFAWLSFIYAIPVSAVVLLVFSALWGNELSNGIFSSIILWGGVLSVCLSISWNKIWLLCVCAAAFEVLIIGWFVFRWYMRKRNTKNKKMAE